MVNFYSFIFLVVFVSGCGLLPYDSTPSPIDSNRYSLEMDLCGQKGLGVNGCGISYFGNSKQGLKFLAPFKGDYIIRSKNCDFEESKRYIQTTKVEYDLNYLIIEKPPGVLTCVFSVMVFPDGFDRGMQGKFILYDLESYKPAKIEVLGKDFKEGAAWIQVREESSQETRIKFNVKKSGIIRFQGCGKSGFKSFDGPFDLSLKDLLQSEPFRVSADCTYFLYLLYDDKSVETASFTLSVYRKNFVDLPDPAVSFDKERLCIEGPEVAAFVSIGELFRLNQNKVCRRLDGDFAWVRMATANGRSVLLGIKNGDVLWRPSIK